MQAPTFNDVKLVGMHFRGEVGKAWAENVEEGTEIFYQREPENQYDSLAIRIMWNFQHVAYVNRNDAAFISPWIDQGYEFKATITGKTQVGRVLHPIARFVPVQETAEEVAEEAYA